MTGQFPRPRCRYRERRYLEARYALEAVRVGELNKSKPTLYTRLRVFVSWLDCQAAPRPTGARREAIRRMKAENRCDDRLWRVRPVVPVVAVEATAPYDWAVEVARWDSARPPKPSFRMVWRASWCRYRLVALRCSLHPAVLRLRITGPQPIRFHRRPVPSRAWVPGIVYMPTEDLATLAETTTTADPGTGGTSLAVTSRSKFPQTTGATPYGTRQFYIVVQDSETDKTNREVMLVTGGYGTGAGSFTVTRGQEGTTGVAHGIGSYVSLDLTATSLKNLKMNAAGVYNVVDQFGALGDGSADDLTAFNNAVAAVPFFSGVSYAGTVFVPGGNYQLSAAPTMPTASTVDGRYRGVTIRGQGMKQTQIKRASGTGVMLDISGTITGGNAVTRRGDVMVRELTLHGNDASSGNTPMIRCFYAQEIYFHNVHMRSNLGSAVCGVEFQDSRFDNCRFESCMGTVASVAAGTASGTEMVRILSIADGPATTGTFGYSQDNSNNVWFTNCNMTSDKTSQSGTILISKNGAPGSQPHRIYFTHNKIELTNTQTSGAVKMFTANWIRFTNADFTGYTVGTNPVTWIEATSGTSISIRNVYFDDGPNANLTHAAMKLSTCTYWTIEDADFNFGAIKAGDTQGAVIAEFADAACDQFYLADYKVSGTRTTPLFSNNTPTNLFTTVRTLVLRKTADQLLAGTSAQNITDLSFVSSTNTDWFIQATIFTNNTASDVGGCKVAVSAPSGSTIKVSAIGPLASATGFNSALLTASGTLSSAFGTVASTPAVIQLQGTVRVAGTGGTVQIQAAEGTNADDITIQANSNLWAQKA